MESDKIKVTSPISFWGLFFGVLMALISPTVLSVFVKVIFVTISFISAGLCIVMTCSILNDFVDESNI